MTKLPLVVVVWNDAWASETAVTQTELVHKPEKIVTIGWLLRDDEVGVQLANEHYDETYRGRTFIPRGMVQSVTHYQLAKPRQKKPVEPKVEGPAV